jgi:hypothetical protein
MIISTDDRDTCFLAIRYATFHLMEDADVAVYLVDSGLRFDAAPDRKYPLCALMDDFVTSGGKVYKARSRATLKNLIVKHFAGVIPLRQIDGMCHNDAFRSIMTKGAYLRMFAA